MNLNATLFAQTIVFLVLALVTMKLIWPNVIAALEERRKKIADGLAAAEKGNASLADAEVRIRQLETDARAKAQEILAQADKRFAAVVDESKAAAKAEADRLIASAKAEIDSEIQRAKDGLRDQVAALAVAGAEKILRREVNAQAHADLLGQLRQDLR